MTATHRIKSSSSSLVLDLDQELDFIETQELRRQKLSNLTGEPITQTQLYENDTYDIYDRDDNLYDPTYR